MSLRRGSVSRASGLPTTKNPARGSDRTHKRESGWAGKVHSLAKPAKPSIQKDREIHWSENSLRQNRHFANHEDQVSIGIRMTTRGEEEPRLDKTRAIKQS